ncbi:hypothetical protein KCU91_g146, partial [Aureobasidium melanogenum]
MISLEASAPSVQEPTEVLNSGLDGPIELAYVVAIQGRVECTLMGQKTVVDERSRSDGWREEKEVKDSIRVRWRKKLEELAGDQSESSFSEIGMNLFAFLQPCFNRNSELKKPHESRSKPSNFSSSLPDADIVSTFANLVSSLRLPVSNSLQSAFSRILAFFPDSKAFLPMGVPQLMEACKLGTQDRSNAHQATVTMTDELPTQVAGLAARRTRTAHYQIPLSFLRTKSPNTNLALPRPLESSLTAYSGFSSQPLDSALAALTAVAAASTPTASRVPKRADDGQAEEWEADPFYQRELILLPKVLPAIRVLLRVMIEEVLAETLAGVGLVEKPSRNVAPVSESRKNESRDVCMLQLRGAVVFEGVDVVDSQKVQPRTSFKFTSTRHTKAFSMHCKSTILV